MKNTANLHQSMVIPFIMMQAFIAFDYWGGFLRAPWSVHVHFVTVSAWYLLLILQPYLISQKRITDHRTMGIIGFAMAGGVGFTAMSMLPNTVGFGRYAEANPGQIPFTAEFFYSIALLEFCLVIAFLFAVYKAIMLRQSKDDHAAWLVSTAFIMLFPSVGRGVQNLSIVINGFDHYFTEIILLPAAISALIIIGATVFVAQRHKILRHPAIMLAIAVNFIPFTLQALPDFVALMSDVVKAVFTLRFEGT